MELTDLQRLKKVVKWLIFSDFGENEKEIAELLGYKKSSFSQIMNGKVPISDKFIDNIASIDDNINKVWIKSGKGSMFKESTQPAVSSSQPQQNDKYTALLEKQVAQLEKINALQEEKIADLEEKLKFAEFRDKKDMDFKIKAQRKENRELSAQKEKIINQQKEVINLQNEEINALKSRYLPPDDPLQPAKGL